jgi:nicotinate-nucleotide pyrophosphorylase (carboxylating)
MMSCMIERTAYEELVRRALREDLGEEGDVTTSAIFADEAGEAVLYSKDTGVLAGSELFTAVYRELDPNVHVDFAAPDGAMLLPREVVARLRGRTASLLSGERVAINFLSFLSGIATAARRYAEAAATNGSEAGPLILDTRKTLPGYRALSKYAVAVGGGKNHRIGLYDMVLIKDNHIDFAGSIARAVDRVRKRWGDRFTIEVECRSPAEVREALGARADIIMLDNMGDGDIRESVGIIAGKAKIEVSGNMDLEKVGRLKDSGVDYISVGRITHSVTAFDFSLRVETHQ